MGTNYGSSTKWNFNNAIKLSLKSLNRTLFHREILTLLTTCLSDQERSCISSVGNFSSNKIWIIEFNPSFDATSLYNKIIMIDNSIFKFDDPNKTKKVTTLRFHFLPSNFTDQTIKRFIYNLKLKELLVNEISNENLKEIGWTNITNGIKRVKITYPLDINKQVQNLVRPTTVFGLKTNITISGQSQRFFFCLDENHTIKSCPLKSLECSKYKLKGHPAIKCSMAEKIRCMERSKIDFSELTVEEDTLTTANSGTIQQYPTSHSSIQPDEILSNTIGPFLADLDTDTKTPVASSSTNSTSFQEPTIPLPQKKIIQAANIPFSQLNDPPTTVRPPGLDSFESELSSNYESNNEMSSNIQTTKPLKQRKKRTSSTIEKSKAKTLRSTSSIDDNAFFDSNEDVHPTKQLF